MKVSVVIVTYLSDDLIADCIDSVFRFNDLEEGDLEVIVVENSPSREATAMAAYLESRYSGKIQVVINHDNLGYGAGNNIGIAHATGDIVVVMNPDVRMSEPLFKKATETFLQHPQLALMGFRQLGNRNLSYYLYPELRFPVFQTLAERISNRLKIFIPSWFYLSGAFMFFDRKKFLSTGGFDEAIFLYVEEADISRRLVNAGYKMHFEKGLSYFHIIDNRIGYSPESYSVLLKSIRYYCTKYGLNTGRVFRNLVAELRFKRFVARLFGRKEHLVVIEKNLKVLYETRD